MYFRKYYLCAWARSTHRSSFGNHGLNSFVSRPNRMVQRWWGPNCPHCSFSCTMGKEWKALLAETISFTFGLCYKYPQITRDDPEKGGDGIGTIRVLSWLIICRDIPSKSNHWYRISQPDRRTKIEEAWRAKQGCSRLTKTPATSISWRRFGWRIWI